jgi:Bifunctional DNA primase/polymerase, N-terminal/Primase C terminal 1 (PriCT-1)
LTPLGAAALKLAQRGLRVFPVRERAKEPAIENNLRGATLDPTIIGVWWASSDYNVGVTCGPGSGIWVLDIDDLEGEQTLRGLEEKHGALPPTVEAITGRGRHLYFKWPADAVVRNSQLRSDLPSLEWRGEGGYVLAPPSVHPSGRTYCWSVDSASEFAIAPDWLIDLVTSRTRGLAGDEPGPIPSDQWYAFLEADHTGSHRESAIARLAGLLLRRYVDPYATLAICHLFNERRCIEPLARAEVGRIVDAIAGKELERRDRRDQ